MGCGCNKNRPNRSQRLKSQKIKAIKTTKMPSKNSRLKNSSSLLAKTEICLSCVESKQNKIERKRGIRVCKKTNRLINNIVRDTRFICPLGKWKNIK